MKTKDPVKSIDNAIKLVKELIDDNDRKIAEGEVLRQELENAGQYAKVFYDFLDSMIGGKK